MPNPNAHLTPRSEVIPAGAVAPDFTLPTQNRGEEWTLSQALKKGDVVISFFPMAFTGVCTTEMVCISKELAVYTSRDAQIVGLSTDTSPTLKAWGDQLGLKQPLLADTHRSVCKAYGLYWPDLNVTWRGTVIVGRDGKVKWSQKRDPGQAFTQDELIEALS